MDFWRKDNMDAISWLILIAGVTSIIFYVLVILWWQPLAYGEECGFDCTSKNWVLELDGDQLTLGEDMTKEECVALLQELEPQTPPFSKFECVAYDVKRQQL